MGFAERERARTVRAGRDPDLVFPGVRADLRAPSLELDAVRRADISPAQQLGVVAGRTLEVVAERPLVDTLGNSRLANLKELRPRGGHLRVLFGFDPRRVAILLLGGDKTGAFTEWYVEMIPLAERLYDEHSAQLREEGEPTD